MKATLFALRLNELLDACLPSTILISHVTQGHQPISRHISIHSLQILTFGPAITFETSSLDFPQKEQRTSACFLAALDFLLVSGIKGTSFSMPDKTFSSSKSANRSWKSSSNHLNKRRTREGVRFQSSFVISSSKAEKDSRFMTVYKPHKEEASNAAIDPRAINLEDESRAIASRVESLVGPPS
jgi:hypothetical protein